MSDAIVPQVFIPFNDEDRIQKLYQYEIINSVAEEAFDRIARLAAQVFDTPFAFVSFVDRDKVFFKSNINYSDSDYAPRHQALCALAILDKGVTFYSDTYQIPELFDNPFVHREESVRSYAGAPLKSPEGYHIGTVSVADKMPRNFTVKQLEILQTLATIVMDELELRLITRKNVRVQADLLNITIHDLKSPLSAIQLYGQMISRDSGIGKVHNMANKISTFTGMILKRLNDLLDLSKIENGIIKIELEKMDICEILRSVKSNYESLAGQKNQQINLHITERVMLKLDRARIQEIFENLLGNAIKYAFVDTVINIIVHHDEFNFIVEFKDEGQGLNETDMEKLFVRYARLSSIPTGKERSDGLGLSIVKTLVDLHQGRVWAESAGKGKGASFYVSLPLN